MNGFLTLDEVVLPAPLPALMSLVLVAGFTGAGDSLLRRLRPAAGVQERCAAFIVATAVWGAAAHGLAMAHLASFPLLRILSLAAVVFAPSSVGLLRGAFEWWRGGWRVWDRAGRFAMSTVLISLLGLLLGALGPVTDPDSLDYHLGVPLDWLRHGGVTNTPHWLHARIVGLGEAVNMLGLAAGTDGLGALLQVAGAVILVAALWSLGESVRARMLGALLALPPVIVPLATAQKPQLLPAAATLVAFLLARTAETELDFALVFGCAGFAMSCKYSFWISGGLVVGYALLRARQNNRIWQALGCSGIAAALFALPLLARNWNLYGDPFSPFLEGVLRANPQGEILQFAQYLKDAGESHTAGGAGRFLVSLLVPSGPGSIQSVLGAGVLAFAVVRGGAGWRFAMAGSALLLLFTVWQGQMAPRYALEPYLWCAAVATAGEWSRAKAVLFYGLAAQTAGVAAMAVFAGAVLFPGALTPGLRHLVMERSTFGYEEMEWIDGIVPPGTKIMVESRAYAVFPRPFFIAECAACGPTPMLELLQAGGGGAAHGSVLILDNPPQGEPPAGCRLVRFAGPVRLRKATRNPLNRTFHEAIAARLECE